MWRVRCWLAPSPGCTVVGDAFCSAGGGVASSPVCSRPGQRHQKRSSRRGEVPARRPAGLRAALWGAEPLVVFPCGAVVIPAGGHGFGYGGMVTALAPPVQWTARRAIHEAVRAGIVGHSGPTTVWSRHGGRCGAPEVSGSAAAVGLRRSDVVALDGDYWPGGDHGAARPLRWRVRAALVR